MLVGQPSAPSRRIVAHAASSVQQLSKLTARKFSVLGFLGRFVDAYSHGVSAPARVDVLYFGGCPTHEQARALVERVAAELGIGADVRLVHVDGVEEAERLRFLGSPTVRVDGRDVEPGADDRDDFAYSCRVYRSGDGLSGLPPEEWVRAALRSAAAASSTGGLARS